MKNIFHRLSIIRIVIAAFFGVGLVFNAYAANIALEYELREVWAVDGYITKLQDSVTYNSSTGLDISESAQYVTVNNDDKDDPLSHEILFWCWTTSTPTNYFDPEQCSPYDVGIVIPSGKTVNTITLRINSQAGTYQWLRFTYSGNGATGGSSPTLPIYCTSKSTVCKLPENKYTKVGYKFVGWDIRDLNSTMTVTRLPGASLEGLISGNKTVTIKAAWELEATKAQVTIDMGKSGLSAMAYNDVCTSARCITPSAMGTNMPQWYGHEFLGWKVLANGVAVNDKIYGKYTSTDVHEFVTEEDMTITFVAQWEPYPYYIKYACSAEDATNGDYVNVETGEFGANFTVISKETSDRYCNKQNYDIARWKYNDIDGKPVFNFGETYKIDILATAYTYELVPEYKPKTYYITYECGDGTMLSGYSNTQEVTFSKRYTTAGKICTKDGYYQTGWQTPNAANGGYFEYNLNTEQDSYGFWGNRTFTATYELSKVVYDCGEDATLIRSECDNIDNDDKCIQNFGSNTTFSPKVKICSKEGAYQVGWKNLNDSDDTYDFYSDYDSDIAAGKTLVPIWLNSKVDIDCDIEFTSTPTALSMPNNISAMTGHSLPDVTTIPVVSGKAFDGWAYHDENNSMWFKYFDQNGSPIRVLDGEHCERGSMTLQAQWIDTGCNEKDVYNGMLATPFASTPIATLYCDDSGACYNNNKCSGTQVDITENTFTKPSNAIYQGIWRHYTPGGASDIRCIDENGVFNYDNLDTCLSMSSDWYVKYTCKNNYVNINGQCVHTTNVYFDGNNSGKLPFIDC
ncbi:MAG: hypothetical protein R8N24_03555 [Alphaproteobacteria bacterium]|nr:hypothetical protein [Alphaproteobacteria bacterium]